MACIQSLPEDVLLNIFSHVDNISRLAVCRLVCKAWDSPAEMTMLGFDEITITSDQQAFALYKILMKSRTKAKLIKYLNICPKRFSTTIKMFLYAAITPNIRDLRSTTLEDETFSTTIMDIVDSSPVKFDKLRYFEVSSSPQRAAMDLSLRFARSLNSHHVSFHPTIDWDYVEKLSEFTNMEFLVLGGKFSTVDQLDKVLDHCSHLYTLQLLSYDWDYVAAETFTWEKTSIQQQHALKTLEIPHQYDCPPEMLNYLLYKYPNINNIKVDTRLQTDYRARKVSRLAALIKKVPEWELVFSIPKNVELRKAIKYLTADGSKVSVEGFDEEDDDTIRLTVEK